jgi:hypothetical protein
MLITLFPNNSQPLLTGLAILINALIIMNAPSPTIPIIDMMSNTCQTVEGFWQVQATCALIINGSDTPSLMG